MTSTTWIKAHWSPSFLVDFLWISCLENRSKKVNIPILAVLNMCEPALDKENRTVVTCLRWLPNTMWIHTKSTGVFQKNIQAKQVTGVEQTYNFQGYWRTWKFQGSIKKEVEVPQECSRKTHVEWLGGNQKNVWLFGLIYIIHLPIPKKFFKFPKICGAEEWIYLNSSHKFIQWNSFLKCNCEVG